MKGWGLCAVLSSGIDKHGMGIVQATQQDGCATISIKKVSFSILSFTLASLLLVVMHN